MSERSSPPCLEEGTFHGTKAPLFENKNLMPAYTSFKTTVKTVSVILEEKCIVLLENCSGTFVDDSYNTTDA